MITPQKYEMSIRAALAAECHGYARALKAEYARSFPDEEQAFAAKLREEAAAAASNGASDHIRQHAQQRPQHAV